MNEILRDYFEKKEAELQAKVDAEQLQANEISKAFKERILKEEGLVVKEYAVPDENGQVNIYVYYETEYVDGEPRFFKYTPIDVTEEEFTRILELRKACGKSDNTSNTSSSDASCRISVTLKVIAWVAFIGSIILGFVLGSGEDSYGDTVFKIGTALGFWCGGAVYLVFTLGFAKIIDLLDKIANKKM